MKKQYSVDEFFAFTYTLVGILLICIACYAGFKPLSWEGYSEDISLWLPEKYSLANKLPNGSYFFPETVSAQGTLISVPMKDFPSLTKQSSQNKVIIRKDMRAVEYLTELNGFTYFAWQTLDRSPKELRVINVYIINDTSVTMSYGLGGLALGYVVLAIFMAIFGVCFVSWGCRIHKKTLQKQGRLPQAA